jgi:hypothetical protein
MTRDEAFTTRDRVDELERMERHFTNLRDMDLEYSPDDAIAEMVADMDGGETMALAEQLRAGQLDKARQRCVDAATAIGFTWAEPPPEASEPADEEQGGERIGCAA